jgi:hypothetical protein
MNFRRLGNPVTSSIRNNYAAEPMYQPVNSTPRFSVVFRDFVQRNGL